MRRENRQPVHCHRDIVAACMRDRLFCYATEPSYGRAVIAVAIKAAYIIGLQVELGHFDR